MIFKFEGVETIETENRVSIFLLLMACASFGLLSISFIKDPEVKEESEAKKASPIEAMSK